jgi:hypothetical protein
VLILIIAQRKHEAREQSIHVFLILGLLGCSDVPW